MVMISVLDLTQTLFGMFLIRRVAKNLQLRTVKEIWGCGDEAPICHRLGGSSPSVTGWGRSPHLSQAGG